jgi:hypothetical protein
MLFEAGGLDVKDTTMVCPHTPNLLTIKNIESKKAARKMNFCLRVSKNANFKELIY